MSGHAGAIHVFFAGGPGLLVEAVEWFSGKGRTWGTLQVLRRRLLTAFVPLSSEQEIKSLSTVEATSFPASAPVHDKTDPPPTKSLEMQVLSKRLQDLAAQPDATR